MKNIILLVLSIVLISCSVESRIKEHSYTNEWFYTDGTRYQVYKQKNGQKYILIYNKKESKLKRKKI